MKIFARAQLAPSSLAEDVPALLLEGGWPRDQHGPWRASLDVCIDARHANLDIVASELATRLAGDIDADTLNCDEYPAELLGYLGALRLRYFAVKLLRWPRYCREVATPECGESWELHLGPGDDVYRDVFDAICRTYSLRATVVHVRESSENRSTAVQPPLRWKRWLSRWAVGRAQNHEHPTIALHGKRILACGDGRLLSPLCNELVQRGHAVGWLCDQPILRLRWRMPRVPQFVCAGTEQRGNRFAANPSARGLTAEGIDLAPAFSRWLAETRATSGARWTTWLGNLDRHLRTFRPDTLVLGEDATPFARAAVLIAKKHGVPSVVVQHGAPGIRFGFTPLAADQIACWDAASKSQLIDWGVPAERIVIGGSLALDQSRTEVRKVKRRTGGPRTILLLANVPPRDERPDAVEFHLSRETHYEMVRGALTAVSAYEDVQLIIKPHPRDASDEWLTLLGEFPKLHATIALRGPWTKSLASADVVLSCGSSAGLEAARLGWPVVQLLPAGSGDILNADRFGLFGTARCAQEVRRFLATAFARGVFAPVESHASASAAWRLAQIVEGIGMPVSRPTRMNREELTCLPM